MASLKSWRGRIAAARFGFADLLGEREMAAR